MRFFSTLFVLLIVGAIGCGGGDGDASDKSKGKGKGNGIGKGGSATIDKEKLIGTWESTKLSFREEGTVLTTEFTRDGKMITKTKSPKGEVTTAEQTYTVDGNQLTEKTEDSITKKKSEFTVTINSLDDNKLVIERALNVIFEYKRLK